LSPASASPSVSFKPTVSLDRNRGPSIPQSSASSLCANPDENRPTRERCALLQTQNNNHPLLNHGGDRSSPPQHSILDDQIVVPNGGSPHSRRCVPDLQLDDRPRLHPPPLAGEQAVDRPTRLSLAAGPRNLKAGPELLPRLRRTKRAEPKAAANASTPLPSTRLYDQTSCAQPPLRPTSRFSSRRYAPSHNSVRAHTELRLSTPQTITARPDRVPSLQTSQTNCYRLRFSPT
jgi:hypothetical protein